MLQVCLNGARRPFEGVPVTAARLAAQAAAAVAASAHGIHVHPRADGGAETLDGDLHRLVLAAIREAAPGVPVGVSTHEAIEPEPVARLAAVRRWPGPADGGPDHASVNWHEDGAVEVAQALHENGIGIEAGLFTPLAAAALAESRWPQRVLRVLVEAIPGTTPGAEGLWAAERIIAALGPVPCPLLVHGEEQWTWPVLRWAQRQGHDTRIGLEDTLLDEHGLRVTDNASLVTQALAGGATT
ncbi:3-keto-5-aminohexanoate cleavage protein [Lapillicoccus jejuensis]|uniref:Uncharacterized protein (DUF849 family) n=1 Tax=Lapillicoccus jejuensis TaxID=402171 RepID=A0A542DXK9_9MICO|nr:3-keto-5-aminohexanoate cleavage protein [Lapillicoccus jejuensis]TQJ07664.1 uncharacterized protein (DUF849 family) [Lapillicoccus jejuensis]